MDLGLITTLLGVIIASILSQTIAVWVKFGNLEKKIIENRCPFGDCPLYSRAVEEAVPQRIIENIVKGERNA